MGNKKGLVTSIFSGLLVESTPPSPSSSSPTGGGQASPPWPSSCRDAPQTASFREPCCTTGPAAAGASTMTAGRRVQLRAAALAAGEMYKTVNSVYFDPAAADEYFSFDGGEEDKEVLDDDDESCFSTTTASEDWSEAVIRSLGRSTSTHRFFFDPGPPSITSICPAAAASSPPPADEPDPNKPPAAAEPDDPEPDLADDDGGKEPQTRPSKQPVAASSLAEGSVAVAVDSADPFGDFRASMEEMVAAHGLRDWPALEELLSLYLRVNGKHNHAVIVSAFVDMLIGLATTTTSTATASSGKSTTKGSTTTTSATTSISTTTTAARKRCGGGVGNGASCSSSSSSCATPDDSLDAAAGEGR